MTRHHIVRHVPAPKDRPEACPPTYSWTNHAGPKGPPADPLRAARLLNAAAATLAGTVLTDSTTEHYRAGFHNPAMFVAPLVSAAVLVTTTHAALRSGGGGNMRSVVLAGSVITGLVGFGFHLTNTSRRVGGWTSSTNVLYSAPIAAPLAATMAGVLGIVASRVEHPRAPTDHQSFTLSARRRRGLLVSALSALGLVGTTAEAAALHFRGAFQNPFMYAPVVVPPITAAMLATAAVTRSSAALGVARTLLRLTEWLGIVGACFHGWGVHRRMGGWHNWRQNVLAGPPLPAPPAFTGLSLAGLAALDLLDPKETR
jgi:hypothetical protein